MSPAPGNLPRIIGSGDESRGRDRYGHQGTGDTHFQKSMKDVKHRIYLASRFSFGLHLRKWKVAFEMLGCEITSTWFIDQEPHEKADEQMNKGQRLVMADRDRTQIDRANTFIMFNYGEHYTDDRTCGRHIEFGYVMWSQKLIIIVGEARSVFHAYADFVVDPKYADARTLLKLMERARESDMPGN